MIGYVRGTVTGIFAGSCFVDVHGVGYRVYVPNGTRDTLVEGEEVQLYTYMNVREDAIQLYGFASQTEYDLFILLISVSGIGPKVGLGILSGMSADGIRQAILNGEITTLTKLPGIGKKSAERLVLELKDKIAGFVMVGTKSTAKPVQAVPAGPAGEVADALIGLGYRTEEFADVLASLDDGTRDVPKLLRAVLAELGKGR